LIQKGFWASLPASSSIPLLLFFSECRIQLSFAKGSSRVDSKRNSGKLTGEQQYSSPADCGIQSSLAEGSSRIDSKRNLGKLTGEQQYPSPAHLL